MAAGTSAPGPAVACSSMTTSVSPPCGSRRITTSARPAGQACACSLSSDSTRHSSDSVWSSRSSGQVPTEWCSLAPGCGQGSSTSRIREAPTTHNG